MTETPCVIVDVQRAGPSTGQATKPASGDVMQVRWGASGDYEIIALSPWSASEMYEMTIQAFNLAEQYRIPVFLLADEAVGHLRESAELKEDIEVIPRAGKTDAPPFGNPKDNSVTPMPMFGQGRKLSVTGSTHDEWGFRKTQSPEVQAKSVDRFCNKIKQNVPLPPPEGEARPNGGNGERIPARTTVRSGGGEGGTAYEKYHVDDAETLVIAYGFTARSALKAVQTARANGQKVGLIRLKTIWPFPETLFNELPKTVKKIFVPEMNQGQVIREVQRFSQCEVIPYNKTDGTIITASEIAAKLSG
jgi:2-oxoglutarate ferredoxin oxidoreductase subunit alpha